MSETVDKCEVITPEEIEKKLDIDVAFNILEHLGELTNTYVENVEKLFNTYKIECSATETSVGIGLRSCRKQVIAGSFGTFCSISDNLRYLRDKLNHDRNGNTSEPDTRN